jgi:hypothetical protein
MKKRGVSKKRSDKGRKDDEEILTIVALQCCRSGSPWNSPSHYKNNSSSMRDGMGIERSCKAAVILIRSISKIPDVRDSTVHRPYSQHAVIARVPSCLKKTWYKAKRTRRP